MPKKEELAGFSVQEKGNNTRVILQKRKGWNFDCVLATIRHSVTGNCGLAVASLTSPLESEDQLRAIVKFCGTNRLLFDITKDKAASIRKFAKPLKLKVLGSFLYHSRYVSPKNRTRANKTLNVLVLEVNVYKNS